MNKIAQSINSEFLNAKAINSEGASLANMTQCRSVFGLSTFSFTGLHTTICYYFLLARCCIFILTAPANIIPPFSRPITLSARSYTSRHPHLRRVFFATRKTHGGKRTSTTTEKKILLSCIFWGKEGRKEGSDWMSKIVLGASAKRMIITNTWSTPSFFAGWTGLSDFGLGFASPRACMPWVGVLE